MKIDFNDFVGKTEFANVIKEGLYLLKWVMKAMPKKDWRPNLFGIQVENIIKGPYDSFSAEFIATDGFRIHHAVAYLPIYFTEMTEGLYLVSFRGSVLSIEPRDKSLILPAWRRLVDEKLFFLQEINSKFPIISSQYLQDAIPPRVGDDTEGVWIRYRKEDCPILINRPANNNNYAIVMPRYRE